MQYKRLLSLLNNPIVLDNLPLVAMVVVYVIWVHAMQTLFGIRNKLVLEVYYDLFTRLTIVFSGLFILLHIRNRSYKKYFTARSLLGVLTVFFLAPLFKSAIASFKQTIPLIHAFCWDPFLMKLDYLIHFNHHPWTLLISILNYPWILRSIDFLYVFWFVLLATSCLWMAWSKRRYLRLCFLTSTLLVMSLLGSGLGTIFSSAGPCYYSQVAAINDDPFSPLMTELIKIHKSKSLWALDNQEGLWQGYQQGYWLPLGGISAMPSIHLAMAMLFVLLAFNINKVLGFIFIGYLLIIQIGSVILGWHYAVDGYFGIIFAGAIWYAVKRFVAKLSL